MDGSDSLELLYKRSPWTQHIELLLRCTLRLCDFAAHEFRSRKVENSKYFGISSHTGNFLSL
ncbi:hypothetical protein E2C01_076935 [Portunus trituberculatus]|uniref:Uncharacterized protein n=1 Tax=Portunus trituberculatus TaxID=210409 RepID=A0A5B7IN92_PORTR|nr:hypothetical protein [Portunus trituberculatus]